jgi:hypothetical protein
MGGWHSDLDKYYFPQCLLSILGSGTQKYLQPHMIKGFSDGGQSSSYSYPPAARTDQDPKS